MGGTVDDQLLVEAVPLVVVVDRFQLEITPVPGDAVQKLVAEIYAKPPEIVKQAAQAVK